MTLSLLRSSRLMMTVSSILVLSHERFSWLFILARLSQDLCDHVLAKVYGIVFEPVSSRNWCCFIKCCASWMKCRRRTVCAGA